MKRLAKGPEPDILRLKGDEWSRRYLAADPIDRPRLEKWRHEAIRGALRQETREKCAYCESIVDHVAFPHVEHILPKTARPELAHTWTNLTHACERCNVYKSDYHSESLPLVNPYTDDLRDHLMAVGPLIDWVSGDSRGEATIRKLRLNRDALLIARAKRLSSIRILLELWSISSDDRREILEDALRLDATEGEYSLAVEMLLKEHSFPIDRNR